MDANKLKVLESIEYGVRKCCGLCQHGQFTPGSLWGTCSKQQYQHLKHTGDARQLSVTAFGGCPGFEADPQMMVKLHGFAGLLK